jgi:hypothetical protein
VNNEEKERLPQVEAYPFEVSHIDRLGRADAAGGTVVRLPARHARASKNSRAAKVVNRSADTLAVRARSVESSATQYSAGILSLCHHLETCVAETFGSSAAKASRDLPQSSMMLRNDVRLDIAKTIGHSVLKRKATPSLDTSQPLGQNVPMVRSKKKVLSDYELQFLARTFAARNVTGKTQAKFADLLQKGMEQDFYKQYETRSMLPHELIDRFLELTGVDPIWLFGGRGKGPAWRERYEELQAKQVKPRKAA